MVATGVFMLRETIRFLPGGPVFVCLIVCLFVFYTSVKIFLMFTQFWLFSVA